MSGLLYLENQANTRCGFFHRLNRRSSCRASSNEETSRLATSVHGASRKVV